MGIRISVAVLCGSLIALPPLHAETPAQLDALARATATPAAGIALARRQVTAGNMLDALATLERVIINSPQNNEARLLHAAVMCRLDDRQGAMVELDQIRGRQIADAAWAEANEACSGRGDR